MKIIKKNQHCIESYKIITLKYITNIYYTEKKNIHTFSIISSNNKVIVNNNNEDNVKNKKWNKQ